MSVDRFGNKYDRLFVALVTPYKENYEVDEKALRNLLRYFMNPKFIEAGGGVVINPEAGEIFYLTREEKRRNVEIAVEECGSKVPVFAGVVDIRTEGATLVAKDAKASGANGLFLIPPIGGMDITVAWDADKYPESFIDFVQPAIEATDLPCIVHPVASSSPRFGIGIPLEGTMKICKALPNIIGWKMMYSYEGSLLIAKGLRSLDRHVGIMCAGAKFWHENLATGNFDGTVSGYWTYAMEPSLEHVTAWRRRDLDTACKIWNSGLSEFQHYVASERSRLHVKYKIGVWLRGLIPLPYMRPPLPKPLRDEVLTMRKYLVKLGLNVISEKDMNAVLTRLPR